MSKAGIFSRAITVSTDSFGPIQIPRNNPAPPVRTELSNTKHLRKAKGFQPHLYVFVNGNNKSRLPWQLSGKESACQCRRLKFDPQPGKILHASDQLLRLRAPQLLSLHAATTEAHGLEPVLHNKRSHFSKKPTHFNKEQSPLAATRKQPPLTATREKATQ